MTGDLPTEASQEPLASCDAAFTCLLQLGGQSGSNEVRALHYRNVVNGETLPISRLIELAGDLGIKAEHSRLDWQRLQTLGFSRPILVLLKNTNVIMLMGGGRGGTSEVAVWDPLDPYGEHLFVLREDLERAWTGHALIIDTPASNRTVTTSSLDFCWFTSAGLELLGKAPAKAKNSKLLVHRRGQASTDSKPAGRSPRTADRTIGRAVHGELALAGVERTNERRPPDPADDTQPSIPALSSRQARRKFSPLARACIAAGVIIAAAGSGAILLRDSATDPIAAALALANEVWAVAPNSAQPSDQAIPNVTALGSESVPRTGSAPIPATLAAPPAAEPDVAAPSAGSAGESSLAENTSAPPVAPSLATPSAEPAAPSLAAAPSAPPGEPDVAARSAAPGLATPAQGPDTRTAAPSASTKGSQLSAEEVTALLARGDTLLSVGDIASARLFYERAADAGGGLAAIRLGETYDPLFLDRVHLSGVRSDPGLALFWYRRARDLGATDAEVLLKALEAKKQ